MEGSGSVSLLPRGSHLLLPLMALGFFLTQEAKQTRRSQAVWEGSLLNFSNWKCKGAVDQSNQRLLSGLSITSATSTHHQ